MITAGFMTYTRQENTAVEPLTRIRNYDEFHEPLPAEQRQQQATRCMNCGVPFCQNGQAICGMISGCPLNNLIPEWNALLAMGRPELALGRLLMTNPFPEFTSRVCPALCEKACVNGSFGEPVTVKENENFIIEYAFANGLIQPQSPKVRTGKRVAVIGSGVAGLAAANSLNQRGHLVTVFEREDRAGGLLMYGIPNMKLEKKIITRRIELMEQEGIQFVLNADVGKSISAEQILKEYDAVILACGASKPRDINVSGRNANGILFAVEYLKMTTKALLDGKIPDIAKGKNVVVIGGGDTGNDCVGSCVRQSCASVVQLEMMPKLPDKRSADNPWCEYPKVCKTDYGQEEATAVFGHDPRIYQTTVKEFISDEQGNLQAVKTVKLDFVHGKPEEISNSEEILPCELCLIAAGFLGSESYITESFGVKQTKRGNVSTEGFCTGGKIFSAGDMHIGQSLVVRAIREGKDCARAVDTYLCGYSNL